MLTLSSRMIDTSMCLVMLLESGLLCVIAGTTWMVTYIFLLGLVEFLFMGFPCNFSLKSRLHSVRCAKGIGAIESHHRRCRALGRMSSKRRVFTVGLVSICANFGVNWAR